MAHNQWAHKQQSAVYDLVEIDDRAFAIRIQFYKNSGGTYDDKAATQPHPKSGENGDMIGADGAKQEDPGTQHEAPGHEDFLPSEQIAEQTAR